MKKTKEELRQEYEAGKVKLTQYQHKSQRLENRINYYEKGERQKRTHRLITRGAAVESIAPEVKGMRGGVLQSHGTGLFSAGSQRHS